MRGDLGSWYYMFRPFPCICSRKAFSRLFCSKDSALTSASCLLLRFCSSIFCNWSFSSWVGCISTAFVNLTNRSTISESWTLVMSMMTLVRSRSDWSCITETVVVEPENCRAWSNMAEAADSLKYKVRVAGVSWSFALVTVIGTAGLWYFRRGSAFLQNFRAPAWPLLIFSAKCRCSWLMSLGRMIAPGPNLILRSLIIWSIRDAQKGFELVHILSEQRNKSVMVEPCDTRTYGQQISHTTCEVHHFMYDKL